jgi:integrase
MVGLNVAHEEVLQNRTAARRRARVEKRAQTKIVEGVDYPTKDELGRMLSLPVCEIVPGRVPDPGHISQRDRLLIHFATATGLRASEIRGLEWRHVDLVNHEVSVEQRADRWNTIGAPKSASGRRTIPIARKVVKLLKEWRLRCPRKDGKLHFVFPNQRGHIDGLPNLHNRVLTRVQRAAGILDATARFPKYGLHSLQHAAS